jgi:predicted enzyme related to lactoylglutathione lyase
MPFVDDTQRAELLAKANEAIVTQDATRANELYRDVVQTITILCNKNQKEIAGELQQLAKSIEEQGQPTEAFEFKQRTCAVMLEISMEDRRRAKGEAVPPPVTSSSTATNTSTTIPSTAHPAERPSSQSNFSPASPSASEPPPTRSRMIGVDTREMEPITIDAAGNSEYVASVTDMMRTQSSATSIDTALPFLAVEYLYMGSSDYERDLTYYRDVLGAQEVWKFDRFGSKITAFSLSAGPLILLSDSRQAPSCQPVFRVSDLQSCARDLTARGWKPVAGPFGTPNGEAYSFEDPSGNRFAIFQVDETSTDRAYFDPTEGE